MASETPEPEVEAPAEKKKRGHKISIFTEFLIFLKENKRWWLIPIITVFLLLGFIIAVTSSSAWAPFIYALF